MKKILISGVSLVILLFIFSGCKHSLFHSHLSEGSIEFKVVILDSNNPMAKMAPDKMTVKFKNNLCYAQIIAGMGFFETDFINDEPEKKVIQLVRMLSKKVSYIGDTAAINKELRQSEQFTFTPTNETKMIAGYKCKKVIATYTKGNMPPFDVYYTDDIEIENPNWATPFKEIKGVLMSYRIKKYGFYMEMTATKVEQEDIDDNLFKIPAEYKRINKEQIDALYKSIQ